MYDKLLLQPCPALRPTAQQFEDPIGYLSLPEVTSLGAEYGIVKVIPPSNWKPPFLIASSFKFHTRLQKLSDLGLTTRSRKFFRDNVNRFLKMRRKRQLRLSFPVKNVGRDRVNVYYYDLYLEVEKLGGPEAMEDPQWESINTKFGVKDTKSNTIRDEYELSIKAYALFLSHNNQNYDFPDSESDDEYDNCLICGKHDHPSKTLLCDNCDNPFHMTCLASPLTAIPTGTWYCDKCLIGTGEYGFEEHVDIKYTLPEFYQMCQEFEQEFIQQYNKNEPLTVDIIEQKFWEFIDIQKSDLEVKYGADIHNLKPGEISGFPMPNTPGIPLDDPAIQSYINHPFNLTKLPFAKGSLLNYINTSISGMTVPWIYIGTLLSTFCWHVEDHYTLSANYCHFGATKKWYGIPSSQAHQFEKLMKESAPDLFKKQPDLLHQLVTLLSPMTLVKNGIKCVYADQNPNEFVITFPRVYHSGFNCGFNFNEAVNFTMDEWLEHGAQSIHDYKLIKKENVFNHYQLIENIIREFNKKIHNKESVSPNEIRLVGRCLSSFESFAQKQRDTLNKLDKSRYLIKHKPKIFKPRSFADEQKGTFNLDQTEEEEDLCDTCKTHISYQYCIINNKSHEFGIRKVEIKQEPLSPKPETINKTAVNIMTTRIPIHQLLTPESSPYDHQKPDSNVDLGKITKSEASKHLSQLSEQESKLCREAEFKQLVDQAKRAAVEADDKNKRRKSRRLQELEEKPFQEMSRMRSSKMSLVQVKSSLRQLNQKETIKLCLDCLTNNYGATGSMAPEGSVLLYEISPLQLDSFIEEAKANLRASS
ncbi:JmjC-domain-containing protein [Suhomyces tanzawaensis NRRL Y-17324]|uniref:JmjC-domain-containing protein n=1 Tax=Suhomyces tanzawaensis NRRL Y-17324 TaxID=984487 RepID=A0A1E4SE02_9ASCO|nr:JmjC-domain-containing protein [Suhomyces tanzawaensis NRRL Y-17324]ODV77713.1 JmjC-domain-containing protein [Suhomyces tanzawaensis NRRL Y-17324]